MQKFLSGINFFAPKTSEDFTFLSKIKKRTLTLGLVCILICIVSPFLALITPISLFCRILIILPAAIVPILFILWMKWHLSSYLKKTEKDSLMKRLGRKKTNYLENIIQNSHDIIFTVDNELYILKFNRGAELQLGYTQEEALGKPLSMLFTNAKKIYSAIKAINNSGNLINTELSLKTKNGEIRQLTLSISRMNYENVNINGYVITAKDITEKKKLEEELRRTNKQLSLLAITDSLTDLYNVRHFYEQIKRELKRHSRNPQRKLSLILIDIDRFKELNDTEGHQMGDHVLASLAQVIKVCIRQDVDSAYRYGGDEFVIILPDTDKIQADVVARRIQKQFGAFKFGMTSLSIGITEAHINDNEETIVKRADDAMYSSKRSGKGYVSIA